EAVLGAQSHQDLPFEKLVEELQPERNLSYNPLFRILFGFQNTPAPSLKLSGLESSTLKVNSNAARFDLSLDLSEEGEGISAIFEYSTDLFYERTIARMAGHFQTLLESIVADPEQRISTLSLLTEAERRQLSVEWNTARVAHARGDSKPLHELIEAHAERTPGAIAVACEADRLTFSELNQRANQLAHYLRESGVGPEALVGIFVERSVDMIVSLLGILKAGGAYLPIDPAYPKERIAFMLNDAKVAVLLTQRRLLQSLPRHEAQTICLDSDGSTIAQRSEENPASGATADNLAYVIYTSGSTGQPKGVQVTHGSVAHLIEATRPLFHFSSDDVWTVFHSYAFDFSVWEIWSPLVHGGKLVIVPFWMTQAPERFCALLSSERVTILNQTPSAIRQLASAAPQTARLALRLVICGGEPFPQELVPQLLEWKTPVWNFYGPTEATVWAAANQAEATGAGDGMVPIGRPLPNMQVYLLDKWKQLVPVGVPGEVHIGGMGLARNYLNRPELTAEKFIPNPFSGLPGARLYKTGDLARRLPDGNIEFLGRLDQQVKIRGFRVELGEVEAALSQHANVREAAVIVRDVEDRRQDKRLVAYVVANQEQVPAINDLRSYLKERLPDYMIPHTFVFLDALPLSPNGKLDRRSLPEPTNLRPDLEAAYVTPQTETERAVAAAWQEVLQLEKVGAHDNFFDLGGHSLLLIQVHSKLQGRFNRDLTVVDLFRYPTVNSLAGYLSQGHLAPPPVNQDSALSEVSSASSKRDGQSEQARPGDIAIIGMSGRFPGASNLEEFWQNLAGGVESITFFSDAALEAAGVPPESLRQPNYVKATSMLDGVELFDAAFFGFNHREAELLDPQHRLFLECSWEAIESSGYDPDKYKGRIGVFAGSGLNSYGLLNLFSNPEVIESVGNLQALVASDKDYLSTRVSYKLNLRGPSLNVNTACSTSLVAVHLACQSLLNGECQMALAGGVSIKVPQKTGYYFQPGGVMSPDGHCRAFDAEAHGTVFGSGVGIVVLKKLSDALADGDYVYAVIKGSAINNDGALKVGYTAPSIEGQAEVVSDALVKAGVHPETIGYIETHGTGTHLGDPIEVAALTQAFRAWTDKKQFCRIGSVKTNIGHLDTAAGVAGLIKTVLSLKREMVPPTLHFEQPNPKIDFENSPFHVNAALAEWKSNGTPRRAAASSFGVGGTNAHIIFEEPPATEPGGPSRPWQLLVISARSEPALERATINLKDHLEKSHDINVADVAYTLKVGRKDFDHRAMLICRDREDALTALEMRDPKKYLTARTDATDRRIAFMFPGLGDHYVNMASGLYRDEPVFREQVDLCCEFLKPHLGLDLREVIFPTNDRDVESGTNRPKLDLRKMLCRDDEQPGEAARKLNQTYLTQPAVFVIELALARLYNAWGIHPQAMIGYSIGEYVAACLSGVLSLEDALFLVAKRAQLIQELPAGAMLAVPLPEQDVLSLLNDDISLSAINGPALCVVSGPVAAIEKLENELAGRDLTCRRLRTSHAFHSKMMEPIIERFAEQVRSISLNPPQIPYISNVTGTWITAAESTDPFYWARHLCEAVRFADGVGELWNEPGLILLEVGPGQTLSSLAIQQAESDGTTQRVALASLPHYYDRQPDLAFLLKTLGQLWLLGKKVSWQSFYAGERRRRLPLPTYPFERQRYWIEPKKQANRLDSLRADSSKSEENDFRLQPPSPDGFIQTGDSRPGFSLHARANARNPYVAPSTDTERGIARIWQELLGVEQIGIHDNFFELGGHSLLATQLISRLKKALPIEMTLRTVYEAPILQELALVVEEMLISKLEELSEDEARKLISAQPLAFGAGD
ncbi:MAG TPA: amino acid adenylation domain-containing protein, partial [Blastocatellia bacterium]